MDYLNELNEAQKKAVLHIEGPSMVIAGAGSGKTRVLTYRIVHLIESGVDPFNILSLTFTNKAAREMKSRISKIVGENEAKNIWMGTFHSVFAKILRIEAELLGYPSNFTIYDTDDAKSLIKDILKSLNLDPKVYKPNLVYNRISSAKNNLISATSYAENLTITNEDVYSNKPYIKEIYKIYERRCFQAGAMDFDDLLFKTNILLRDNPSTLLKYQDKFKFILVDEFQDTNFSQFTILKKLAARFENICVVGDDAQSIYAFRGANIQNILNFKKTYPDTQVYKLEQNYRSTQNIVNAANSIIEKNQEQLKKNVWTSNVEGEKIKLIKTMSDNEEGMSVGNEIFTLKNNHQLNNQSFAVLYRTNAQSRAIEEALRKLDINYKIYGGLSFYQRKEIKDVIAYFRLTANPKDEEALKRIINYPARGIGKTTMEKALLKASELDESLWHIISNSRSVALQVSNAVHSKLDSFVTMMKSFRINIENENAYDLGSKIAGSSGVLKDLYADKTIEGQGRYENVQELLSALKDFSEKESEEPRTLSNFLTEVSLFTDADSDNEEDDHVSLMTIHSAKGLEFPYVFIVGMEEGLFPSQLSLNSRMDLEEERRLFYVALTRAEKKAILSFATTRYRWGSLTHGEPSRFLEDVDPKFIEMAGRVPTTQVVKAQTLKKPYSALSKPRKLVSLNSAPNNLSLSDDLQFLKSGALVEHGRFGKGKVIIIEGPTENKKATVNFDRFGEKQLLLKFAKLKILSN